MKLIAVMMAALAAGATASTNLKKDCNAFIVDDHKGLLYATCSHNGGPPSAFGTWDRVSAKYDLNSVMVNDNGKLAWLYK